MLKLIPVFLILFFSSIFPQESIETILKKIEHAQEKEKFDLYFQLGHLYDRYGEYNNSMSSFQSALEIGKKLKDTLKIADAIHNIGMVWDTKGDFILAVKYYNESLELYKRYNNIPGIVQSLLGLANIDRLKYNFDEGIANLQKADSLSDISGDKNLAYQVTFNYGIFYLRLKDYPKTLTYLEKALELSKLTGNRNGESRTLGSLGVLFSAQKQFEKSNEYYKKSLRIREQLNDIAGIASSNNNLGENYLEENNFSKALEHFNTSYLLRVETGNKYGIAQSETNLAKAFIKLNRYDDALAILKKSNKYALSENILHLLINNYNLMADAYRFKSNYKLALEYYMKYFQLKDSVSLSDYNKRINELLQKIELKKHENEIHLLRSKESEQVLKLNNQNYQILLLFSIAVFLTILTLVLITRSRILNKYHKELENKNEEILLQKKELEELVAMKDKFFTIIAHDLKNPFNALLGFSTILYENYNTLSDEDKLDIIKDLKTSSSNSYKLLQNLLEWSRSQTGRLELEANEFSVRQAVDEVIEIHKSGFEKKKIRVNKNIDDKITLKSDINIFNTIVRNIFSNAVKFTNFEGTINISGVKSGNSLLLKISDNGTGMEKEQLESLFDLSKHNTKKGTDNETGTGLGLILCKEFTSVLKGNIEVESKPGEGSSFSLFLPDLQ